MNRLRELPTVAKLVFLAGCAVVVVALIYTVAPYSVGASFGWTAHGCGSVIAHSHVPANCHYIRRSAIGAMGVAAGLIFAAGAVLLFTPNSSRSN